MGIGGISLWQLLFLVVIGLALVGIIRSVTNSSGAGLICSRCGTANRARTHTRGSISIEILLWLMFIIPGLIYSIWRLTTRAKVCAACSSAELVPLSSPAGKELLARYGQANEEAQKPEPSGDSTSPIHNRKPVSRPTNTGYSITGAENSPASTRSGTRPTGSPKPSGGRRE